MAQIWLGLKKTLPTSWTNTQQWQYKTHTKEIHALIKKLHKNITKNTEEEDDDYNDGSFGFSIYIQTPDQPPPRPLC